MASTIPYFYAWETVDLDIALDDPSALLNYNEVVVSIRQGYSHIEVGIDKTISAGDIDAQTGMITCSLSQNDTKVFQSGLAKLQVNIYYQDSERDTSEECDIEVRNNLYKQIMP